MDNGERLDNCERLDNWTEGPRPKGGTAPKGLLLLVMADFCEQLDKKSQAMNAAKMAL